jgi:hypothetical protein
MPHLPACHQLHVFGAYFALLTDRELISIDIGDRLDGTEGDTLGIAVAVITLDGYPVHVVKRRGSERAGDDAGLASDAKILVDDHPLVILIPVTGLGRTDFGTERFLAVLAGLRQIETDVLPLDHPDARSTGVAGSGMKHRADHLALPASRAFFLVDHDHLALHCVLPYPLKQRAWAQQNPQPLLLQSAIFNLRSAISAHCPGDIDLWGALIWTFISRYLCIGSCSFTPEASTPNLRKNPPVSKKTPVAIKRTGFRGK